MAKTVLFSIVCVFLINGLNSLSFDDCGSKVGKFTSIKVSGCDESKAACVLHRNTNASIEFDLNLVERDSVENVTAVCHGIVMGVEMPFPLPNPNGCVDSGLECPLNKEKSYAYVATLPVLKAYPKVKVTVKWELRDENNECIICVLIPAKIE